MSQSMAFISNKAYFPVDHVDLPKAKARYTIKRYEETICRSCDNLPNRHDELCDVCPRGGFLDSLRLYRMRTIRGEPYIGLPLGDKRYYPKLGILFSDYLYVDRRVNVPFSYDVRFTATLYDYQQPVADTLLKAKFGVLKCPPRTGKTAMMLYTAIKLGQRTLVIANQHEFLRQMENHIKAMTNLDELEQQTGRKLYGFAKDLREFEAYLICVTTYQRFLSPNGQQLLEQIRPLFGTVMVDEIHTANALKFSQVLGSFQSKYLIGCTATVERKDMRHVIIERLVGPVTAESKRDSLPVMMTVTETPLKAKVYKLFTYAMRYISNDDKRNDMILQQVLADLKAGRSLVIPLMFKSHVFLLTKLINDAWGSEIAESFVGGGDVRNKKQREETLERARAGQTRVVVAIRKMVQLGIDCLAWDTLYEVTPISNRPNLLQETSRIRTANPNKPNKKPLIRWFVDTQLAQSLGCFRSSVGHLNHSDFADYTWTENAKQILKVVLKGAGKFYGKDVDLSQQAYTPVRTLFGPASLSDHKVTTAPEGESRRRRL
jgi:superfamily II DNA or RNA helicase